MRRGIFIVGIVLVAVGVIVLGLGYYAVTASQSQSVPAGSALEPPTSSFVGGVSVSVSWSGGSSSTQVFLTSSSPVCPGSSSNTAHGSGASGSLTASLTSGTTYYLYACSSSAVTAVPQTISVSYTASGLSYLMLIGIIIAILGVVVAVVGMRLKPSMKAEEGPEDVSPPSESPYAMPSPITSSGLPPGPAATAAAPTTPIGVRSEPAEPARFMPASEDDETPAKGPAPGTTARANRVCTFCGTVNEPWITNCRKCKRTLSSTSD